MLTGFDHVTVVVNDVAAATARFSALIGTPPRFRGGHPELGAEAALFGFENALVELTGPAPSGDAAEGLRTLLRERGEGLHALAFSVADASSCSAALRARGVRATPASDGEACGEDGVVRHFRTAELSPRATRGPQVLVVERADTARLRGEPSAEPAACHALDHVVLRTADASAARTLYGDALGIRLALDTTLGGTQMLFFRIGGVTLEVVVDPAQGERDSLWGLAYRVADIHAAHARIASAGFSVSAVRKGQKPGTHVFTVRDAPAGVPTLVLHDPARTAKPARVTDSS